MRIRARRVQQPQHSIVDWRVPEHSNDLRLRALNHQSVLPGGLSGEDGVHRPRIAMYSHDAMGLGHMRRNLLIAQTFASSPLQATVLLITGASETTAFKMPQGIDCLTLPALHKHENGHYQSRSLGIGVRELIGLREKILCSALEAFKPDVFIVDKVPRGLGRELDAALEYLCAYQHTRCVLGLRDVLDHPATVSRQWYDEQNEDAIRRYYEAVWIYGDPKVYDPVREYQLPPDIAKKVHYTGYLDQRLRLPSSDANADPFRSLGLPQGKLALCLLGGGQDGACLAEAFVQADMPADTNAIIVTGPFMPADVQQRLHKYAATRPYLRILEFVPEPAILLQRADRVVAMGGYNTIAEILSFDKPALIVPRVRPRTEQLIRAQRLCDLGLLDMLHPEELSPRLLTEWLAREKQPGPRACDLIDLDGLKRLPGLLEELIAPLPQPMSNQSSERETSSVAR